MHMINLVSCVIVMFKRKHLSFPFWFCAVPYDRKTCLIPGSSRRHKTSKREDLTRTVAYKKESKNRKQTVDAWNDSSNNDRSDSASKNVSTSKPSSSAPLKKKHPSGMSFREWKNLNSKAAQPPTWCLSTETLENLTQALATGTWGMPKQIGGGSAAVNWQKIIVLRNAWLENVTVLLSSWFFPVSSSEHAYWVDPGVWSRGVMLNR